MFACITPPLLGFAAAQIFTQSFRQASFTLLPFGFSPGVEAGLVSI